MAEMKTDLLEMPTAEAVVRENGDAVVEVRHDGVLVGELNFSRIFRRWGEQLGFFKRPAPDLKSVP